MKFHIGEVYDAVNKAESVRLKVDKILLNQDMFDSLTLLIPTTELKKGYISTLIGYPVEASDEVETYNVLVK